MEDDQGRISVIMESLADKWPSTFVARTDVPKFTGGLISEKYIANLDSRKKGPDGRFRSGRKICYPVRNLCDWLKARSSVVEKKTIRVGAK